MYIMIILKRFSYPFTTQTVISNSKIRKYVSRAIEPIVITVILLTAMIICEC